LSGARFDGEESKCRLTYLDSNIVNFVDLDAIAAGMEGEVLKPQGGDEGCPKFDFLKSDAEFQIARGLVENLPDMTEIVHPKGFFLDAVVEGEKVAHGFLECAECRNSQQFWSHTIGAATDIRLDISERTLAPMKHPLDDNATHSDMNTFDAI
jgi:hypothetical protein